MQAVNICGYGNTGCTALFDLITDYEGVGFVHNGLHEIGILKCQYSFGGAINNLQSGQFAVPTKDQLRHSLKGEVPDGAELSFSANLHLEMRARVAEQYGDTYDEIVENALAHIPDNHLTFSPEEQKEMYCKAAMEWIRGVAKYIPDSHFPEGEYDSQNSVMLFKNDPPGAYPFLSTMLPGGRTGAVLRDPRDTCFDFNRHYKIETNEQTVRNFCAHYNSQLNTAKAHLTKDMARIKPFYFVVEFESLVNSASARENIAKILIGERRKVRNKFQPSKSSVNLNMYDQLPPDLLAYVEENCMPVYTKYKAFIADAGILIE